MKNYSQLSLSVVLALVACGTSTTTIPTPPTLGATEIDRMGRPAINTALTNPFDTLGSSISINQAKDEYNANATPSTWTKYIGTPGTIGSYFAGNLAIFDALDTVCGNQLAAAATVGATQYKGLASVLADDALYVNTASGTCAAYLGVELNGLGVMTNTDCGGRTPLEDVIDATYGAISGAAALGDGVAKDGDGVASLSAFPFLSSPN